MLHTGLPEIKISGFAARQVKEIFLWEFLK